jgi:hypothetical protein
MSMERFPVGSKIDVSYPDFQVTLTLQSTTQLTFDIQGGRSPAPSPLTSTLCPLATAFSP